MQNNPLSSISPTTTDNELVELTKTNSDNLAVLIDRYWSRLFAYIKRISYFSNEDIEDILQEVFIKVYKNLNAFDPDLKFSTWVYQITRNQTIDQIRKTKARPQTVHLEDNELLTIFKSSVDLEKEFNTKEHLNQIKEIINNLPFKYKEVMILKFLEEKSYEEIMDIVKKPKGTVASLINRGREMVTNQIKQS